MNISDQTEPLLFTLKDAARRLSVSKRTLERENQRGRLRVVRIGRSVRVRHADLLAYLSGTSAAGS